MGGGKSWSTYLLKMNDDGFSCIEPTTDFSISLWRTSKEVLWKCLDLLNSFIDPLSSSMGIILNYTVSTDV